MTPKEKAIELIDKFFNASFNCNDCVMPYCEIKCTMLSNYEAKQCALITVDEILKEIDDCFLQQYDAVDRYYYYKEVKQEIEKL